MTPRQLYREMRLVQKRIVDERERQLTQAWEAAALTASAMVGKLPKLDRLLADIRPKPKRLSLSTISQIVGVAARPASPEAMAALKRLESRLG